MKILVTGANGQLGYELRPLLDARFTGSVLYTDIEELDLTDAKAVEAYVVNNDITHIVNCAAYTAVDRAEEEKMECTRINCDAVKNIAMVPMPMARESYIFPPTTCSTAPTTAPTASRTR